MGTLKDRDLTEIADKLTVVLTQTSQRYGYYALERHGWASSRQAPCTPCFPQASGRHIRARGGASATHPTAVQPFAEDSYEIFSDPPRVISSSVTAI